MFKPSKILIIFLIIINSNNIIANETYFDLSEDTVKITTDFKGKEIIIFGLLKKNEETILTIIGPYKKTKITEKEKIFGFWFNSKQIVFKKVPNIFFIASSAPVEKILPKNILLNEGIGFKSILEKNILNKKLINTNNYKNWIQNIIRIKKEKNLYKDYKLKEINNKLFQTRVFFPSNSLPGDYNLQIYQIKNNTIIGMDTRTITIEKSGIGNDIYNFAHNQPLVYGLFTILFAILSGLIAATLFRRI